MDRARGGVWIRSSGNLIGGVNPGEGNVVTGFDYGVSIDLTASLTLIQSNSIGTDPTGSQAIGGGYGVRDYGASSTTIGGSFAVAGNLISGNRSTGISAAHQRPTNLQITGNMLGTDFTGTLALPNGGSGIKITPWSGESVIVIGGGTPEARNVISGNNGAGIYITASSVEVQGSFIGSDLNGEHALPNGNHGFQLSGSNCTIGGQLDPAEGNLIAFNTLNGVDMYGNANTIVGNSIFSNGEDGLELNSGDQSIFNQNQIHGNGGNGITLILGSQNSLHGNQVYDNGDKGIVVGSGLQNSWRQSTVYGNGGLGIDLGDDGPTPNDPNDTDVGVNWLQNSPRIISARIIDATTLEIRYTVDSHPSVVDYDITVEFFDDGGAGDHQGRHYLGSDLWTEADWTAREKTISVASQAGTTLETSIVATATDAIGNSSEFSTPAMLSQIFNDSFENGSSSEWSNTVALLK